MTKQSKSWSSWFSFVVVSVGAAIGLGNLWKFPYIVWKYGGGAFVGVYLLAVCCIAFPVLAAELCLGKATRQDVFAAFTSLSQGNWKWRALGMMIASTPFMILSYYGTVTGWTLYYSGMSAVGFLDASSVEAANHFFFELTNNSMLQFSLFSIVMLLSGAILFIGLKGLESCGKILLPLLFIMMFLTACIVCSRYGAYDTVMFLTDWNLETLSFIGVLEAFGHAFLTLSLGMGITVAYGSYLGAETSVFRAALTIAAFDTVSALLACFMIFPILFGTDIEVSESTAVLFTSLAVEYGKFSGGEYLTTFFFSLTFVAALTSCVALLEACLATFEVGFHWTRSKSICVSIGLISGIGCLGIVSQGYGFRVYGKSMMDTLDFWCSTIATPLGGMAVAWCCATKLKKSIRREALASRSHSGVWFIPLWEGYLKYISPVLIFVIILSQVYLSL
ncbi:MAG: sodium-dependent transporter [Oligoflexales bacterium]